MKGFKPTGYGPSAGFKFPASFGFTGSTGAYTNVQPYIRQKPRAFKDGGYVSQTVGDTGSALVRRARPYTNEDQQSGGRSPLRPGFKDGGKNWIKGAIKHPGALHAALGVPAGQKIPAKKLNKAAHSDNPTMRRRANLAKTLKKMHKADGGPVARPKGMGAMSDKEVQMMLRKAMPRKPTMPATGMKSKFAAADGGEVVYGSSSKGFGSDLRKTGEFIGQIPRLLKEAAQGSFRRTQEDVARDKRRRIDSIADGTNTASNYARGGMAKSDMAQDRKMIGTALRKHVNTPAPKGHKGLGKMCK